ncbi:MAG: hypothetical protein HY275_06070 [Gemmatimonadetes bacterium]|nr:hypothetical protein [Gemmatimonadota bacterium]
MPILRRFRGFAHRLVLPVIVAAALVAGACTNSTANSNAGLSLAVEDTGQLFAMSGVPTYYPAGLNLTTRNVVVVTVFDDGTVPFDVAFDLTPGGQVRVLPPRTVALGPTVGPVNLDLLKSTAAWSAITEAPQTGYIRDTIQTIGVGQPIIMQLRPPLCALAIAGLNTISAKFIVDSVNVPARKIFFRLLANPNCGRRGLVPNQY